MIENIPKFLLQMLEKQYGMEITNKIVEGYSKTRKVSLRVNTLKADVESVKEILQKENIIYKTCSWSKEAIIVENAREDQIRSLEIYDSGKIYLQSLSSMLPPIVLNPKKENDILDMAAAPGGKTTQMASIVENKATITACEMNKIRAERLKYNIKKQGASCVYVMITDSRKIDNMFSFDQILLDAPCSGSGTLNIYDKNLNSTFTTKLIEKSIKAQKELLKKAIDILKPGHEMVYSTCSILEEENEQVLKEVLKGKNVKVVPINLKEKNISLLPTKIDGTLCICPNDEYEGFFIAKLLKGDKKI